ncbi:baeRF2 domain-containing protein [Streptomyces winkii]|uniref:baeRF2 domain-containing protein n=1 Tax=Streptomyces winkii TaxID=3051178 RepID=UPI0028D2EBB5|nr:Vms1/Ankzf1 family peptidyl-tRNA hydrolase [Streptomyces sp. DSM 40971]
MELGFLGPLLERQGPWASVYFDTTAASEDAAARQKLVAKSAREQLKDEGADDATCRAVYDRLVSLPRGAEPPGHAVFAAHGEVVLDTELTEPPPGGGPLVAWQALPRTGPLVELADGDPPGLVAYIDRKGAEFELTGPLGAQAAGRVTGSDWPVHRTPTGDWSERHFQTAVENTWEQNAAEIAEELRNRWEKCGAEVLVLAGDARERNSVHSHLPADLRERTVQAEHGVRADSGPEGPALNTAGGRRLLKEEVAEARSQYARRRVAEALERFQAGRAPSEEGRIDAAEGVPALAEAAREHRIGVLLVRPEGADLRREVWVGDEPGQLAVRRSEAQYLGATESAPARADDALLRSAAATGADVLCVRDADVPEGVPRDLPDGGLGALLRWPHGGAPEGGGTGGGQHATR